MRIVLVYQHFMVSGSGSTKPYDLAKHLVSAGHQVTVVCGRSFLAQGVEVPGGLISRLKISGIHILCLGVDYQQKMGFARRIYAFLAFTFLSMLAVAFMPRFDVLVASSTPLTVGLVGLVSRYLRRRPWVFEIRDLWPECPYQSGYLRSRALFRIATFFEEWFYRSAAATSAISKLMVDRLVERGFPPAKLHFIPTGMDVRAFDVPPDPDFRRSNALDGKWVAVYVGAHGRANGLDYILEAATHLRQEEDVRIVLIGGGTEKDRLLAEADRRGLLGRPLIFLPPVPQECIPPILLACDAMLMLNVDRPGMKILMPNKFFDYLAAGRPLIVNIRAEVTDWILSAHCGLLADPGHPEDFARAVRDLRSNPDLAREMGRRARRLAQESFDRAELNRQWESLLAQVAG